MMAMAGRTAVSNGSGRDNERCPSNDGDTVDGVTAVTLQAAQTAKHLNMNHPKAVTLWGSANGISLGNKPSKTFQKQIIQKLPCCRQHSHQKATIMTSCQGLVLLCIVSLSGLASSIRHNPQHV
eukprot:1160527-Pelagomonas_calceolata.AAC.11